MGQTLWTGIRIFLSSCFPCFTSYDDYDFQPVERERKRRLGEEDGRWAVVARRCARAAAWWRYYCLFWAMSWRRDGRTEKAKPARGSFFLLCSWGVLGHDMEEEEVVRGGGGKKPRQPEVAFFFFLLVGRGVGTGLMMMMGMEGWLLAAGPPPLLLLLPLLWRILGTNTHSQIRVYSRQRHILSSAMNILLVVILMSWN